MKPRTLEELTEEHGVVRLEFGNPGLGRGGLPSQAAAESLLSLEEWPQWKWALGPCE